MWPELDAGCVKEVGGQIGRDEPETEQPYYYPYHVDSCPIYRSQTCGSVSPNNVNHSFSIVSRVSKHLFGTSRRLGRSALTPLAFPFVCFDTLNEFMSGSGSPGLPPKKRNGPRLNDLSSRNAQTTHPEGFFANAIWTFCFAVLAPFRDPFS